MGRHSISIGPLGLAGLGRGRQRDRGQSAGGRARRGGAVVGPLAALFLALLITPGFTQTTPQPEAATPGSARAAAPHVQAEAPPRPRSRNPRDRAYMDGGMAVTPGFSTGVLGGAAAPAGRSDLAPRPNLDMELRSGPASPETATLSPTMIHPRLPSGGAAADGAASQREQRLLQSPAAGARLSVPMTW